MTSRGLASLFAFALLVGGRSASASAVFPDEVKSELRLAAAPPCTLCHQNDLGGTGTATKRFAVSLKRYGVRGLNDLAALDAALAELEARGVDSDGDGAGDIAELVTGDDPNVAAPTLGEGGAGGENGAGGAAPAAPQRGLPPEIPMLETGCAISTASKGGSSTLVTAVMTLAAVALRVRRRRQAARVFGKLRRCPTERG